MKFLFSPAMVVTVVLYALFFSFIFLAPDETRTTVLSAIGAIAVGFLLGTVYKSINALEKAIDKLK